MIALSKLNGQPFVLNADLIETLEATPDTIVKLTNGKTLVAKNSIEDIVKKIIKYKQLCHQNVRIVNETKDNLNSGDTM